MSAIESSPSVEGAEITISATTGAKIEGPTTLLHCRAGAVRYERGGYGPNEDSEPAPDGRSPCPSRHSANDVRNGRGRHNRHHHNDHNQPQGDHPCDGTAPIPASVQTIVVEMGGESGSSRQRSAYAPARMPISSWHLLSGSSTSWRTWSGREISGWPTTTYRLQTDEERAKWRRDLRVAGVTAMALAGLVDQQAAIQQAWRDYEQGYADPNGGWSPPDASRAA